MLIQNCIRVIFNDPGHYARFDKYLNMEVSTSLAQMMCLSKHLVFEPKKSSEIFNQLLHDLILFNVIGADDTYNVYLTQPLHAKGWRPTD